MWTKIGAMVDSKFGIISGRPFGGVAILIRKKLRQYCNFLFYDDARIIGLELKFLSENIYLLNYGFYVEYIGKISAIIEDCSTSKLAIIGDFNANVVTIRINPRKPEYAPHQEKNYLIIE